MLVHGRLALVAVVLAGALLAAAAPAALPSCDTVAASQREAARLAGRCAGKAPIINVSPDQLRRPREARSTVPDVRGRVFNRSDTRLANYVVSVDYRESAQRRDWVLDQMPRPPARLAHGAPLRIVLSDGTLVRVPNVRGGFARALTLLHRAGLSWSVDDGVSGPVVGQAPGAGAEVRPGTAVVLRIGAAASGSTPGPVALAPESTRPEVAPPQRPAATPPASTAPATRPAVTPSPAPATPAPSAPAARSAPPAASMPDVQGMTFDAARERLSGFDVQRVHRAGTEAGGTVIGQTPAAGAPLGAGTSVRLVLSDGSLVRVPRVMSFTLNEARQRLASGELRVTINDIASDSPAGTVVSQQPAEGQIVARGTAVRVNVSSGPAATALSVPNVVGSPFERAQSLLSRFRVERSERGAREPAGTVLEQSPAAGTRIEPGAVVALIVSSGGRPESIEVPNVVAQEIDAATAALSEFRVEREPVASVEPAGRVLTQEPAAGSSVAPGGSVRLRISDGSRLQLPSFTARRVAQARADAQANGLTLTISDGPDDADAIVRDQQPAAGTEVARGGEVRVTVEPRAPALPPAWRASAQRFVEELRAVSPLVVALAALALLLLLVAISVRRRRAEPTASGEVVEPILAMPPITRGGLMTTDAPPVPTPGEASPPMSAPDAAVAAHEAEAAVAITVPSPEQVTARARLESEPAATVARGAAPRGPEILVQARLDAGSVRASELGPVRDEMEEAK